MAATAIAGQQMEMMAGRRTQSRAVSLAERNRELYEAQRRARRGPTPEVFFTKHIDNSRIVKADDPERRREMRTFSAVMSVLFMLVMVELVRLLILYLEEHRVAVDFMVELGIVATLREIVLRGVIELTWQQITALSSSSPSVRCSVSPICARQIRLSWDEGTSQEVPTEATLAQYRRTRRLEQALEPQRDGDIGG